MRVPWTARIVKAMVFPVVMYGCESWTVKKAEHQRIDAFALWCWRRLLRVPWTARRSNQSILKEISPGPGRWQASLDWVGATPGPQAPSRASGNRASTGRGVPGSAPWAPGSQGLWEQRPGVPKPRRAVCLPGVSAPPLSPAGNSQAPREPGRPEAATSCRPELSGSLSCASLGSSWFY